MLLLSEPEILQRGGTSVISVFSRRSENDDIHFTIVAFEKL